MSFRKQIIKQWQAADTSTDMDKSYKIYCDILKKPGLSFALYKDEILNIRFNRAINNIEIANWYLENRQYPRAHTHFKEALEDRKKCAAGYSKKSERDISAACVKESERHLAVVLEKISQQAAVLPPMPTKQYP